VNSGSSPRCKRGLRSSGVLQWIFKKSEYLKMHVNFCLQIVVKWRRRLVAGLSRWRSGFNSRLVLLRSLVDEVAVVQVFIRVLRFPLSVSFHQRPLFFIYMLLLRRGETGEALGLPNSGAHAEIGALDRKMRSIFLVLKRLKLKCPDTA
jgi:hypothetical protein